MTDEQASYYQEQLANMGVHTRASSLFELKLKPLFGILKNIDGLIVREFEFVEEVTESTADSFILRVHRPQPLGTGILYCIDADGTILGIPGAMYEDKALCEYVIKKLNKLDALALNLLELYTWCKAFKRSYSDR